MLYPAYEARMLRRMPDNILKHVGVLYQTMYLVATSMGLAPCGLGGGNADAFAAAAGTSYYEESSVGGFLLGSKPEDA